MSDVPQLNVADASVNSIIGEGTTLRGEFELNGLLRIDGTFFGTVKTSGKVLVGKNGRAECTIIAGTVVIGGKVRGDVIADERITLLSTGEVIGNIKAPRLVIEEGVVFNGTCEVIRDRERLHQTRRSYMESRSGDRGTPSLLTSNRSSNPDKVHEQLARAKAAALAKEGTAVG